MPLVEKNGLSIEKKMDVFFVQSTRAAAAVVAVAVVVAIGVVVAVTAIDSFNIEN